MTKNHEKVQNLVKYSNGLQTGVSNLAQGAPWAPWGPWGPHGGPMGAHGGPWGPMGPLAPIPPSGYSCGVAPPGHITLVDTLVNDAVAEDTTVKVQVAEARFGTIILV